MGSGRDLEDDGGATTMEEKIDKQLQSNYNYLFVEFYDLISTGTDICTTDINTPSLLLSVTISTKDYRFKVKKYLLLYFFCSIQEDTLFRKIGVYYFNDFNGYGLFEKSTQSLLTKSRN
jgi:hypothetical protein